MFLSSIVAWVTQSWWPKFLFMAYFLSFPVPHVLLAIGVFFITKTVAFRFKHSADWSTFWRSFLPDEWNVNRELYYGFGFTAAAFIVDLLRAGMRKQLESSRFAPYGIKMIKAMLIMWCVPTMGPVKGMAFVRAVTDGATSLVEGAYEAEKTLQSGYGGEKEMEKAITRAAEAVAGEEKKEEKILDSPPVVFVPSSGSKSPYVMTNNPMDWAAGFKSTILVAWPGSDKETLSLMKKFAMSDDEMTMLEVHQAVAGWHNWFNIMREKQYWDEKQVCAFPEYVARSGFGVRQYFTYGQAKKWWMEVGVWNSNDDKVITHRPTMLIVSEEEMVKEITDQPTRTIWQRMRRQFNDIKLTLGATEDRKQIAIFFLVVACTFLGIVVAKMRKREKMRELKEANAATIAKSEQLKKEVEIEAKIADAKKKLENLETEKKLEREMRSKERGDTLDINHQKNIAAVAARMEEDILDRKEISARDSKGKRDSTSQNKDNMKYNEQVKQKVAAKKERRNAKAEYNRIAAKLDAAYKEWNEFLEEHPAATNSRAAKIAIFEKHGLEPKWVDWEEKEALIEANQIDFYRVFLSKIGTKQRVCRTCFYGKTEHVVPRERPDWHKEKYPRAPWNSTTCIGHAEIVRLLKMNEASLKAIPDYGTVLAIHLNWDAKPATVMKAISTPEAMNVNVHNVEDVKEFSKYAFFIKFFGSVDGVPLSGPGGCNGVHAQGLHIIPLHFYQVLTSKPVQTTRIEVTVVVDGELKQTDVTDEKHLLEFDRIYAAQLTNDQLSVADQMVIPTDWWRKAKLPNLASSRIFTNQPIVMQSSVSPCFRMLKDGKIRFDFLSISSTRRKFDSTTPDGKFLAESLCYLASTQFGDCGFGFYVQRTLVCVHREGNVAAGEQAGRILTPQLVAVLNNANNLSLLFPHGDSSRRD